MNSHKPKLTLHVAPTPFFSDRGCHIRIEGIVRCLRQLGWDSLVCTYHHGQDVDGVTTTRISPIRAYTQTSAGPNPWKLWADLKLLWLVLKETKKHHPRILHAHLHEGLFIALLTRWCFFWRRIPVVADLQGSFTGELDSHGVFNKLAFLKPISRLCERILMWFPAHIVCSSARSLTLFSQEFKINPARISLAQDGADEGKSLSESERQSLREQYGLPLDKAVVVYSGALLAAKGLNELQALIKAAAQANAKTHFLIIGYPTQALSEFLKKHQLEAWCTVVGQVPFAQLQPLLMCADIAIDPKNFDAGEGSGKMLNYIACRLPVLAFDTQNNKAFLPPNSALADSPTALLELLIQWSQEPHTRQAVGHKNLRFFQANFSWAVTQKQLAVVYHRVTTGE